MNKIFSTLVASALLTLAVAGSANAFDADSFFEEQERFGEVRVDADSASEGRVLVPNGIFTGQ
ncbi:MAG: hypothetical protein AAFV69_13425 [Pseudomonadota bacterium]